MEDAEPEVRDVCDVCDEPENDEDGRLFIVVGKMSAEPVLYRVHGKCESKLGRPPFP